MISLRMLEPRGAWLYGAGTMSMLLEIIGSGESDEQKCGDGGLSESSLYNLS